MSPKSSPTPEEKAIAPENPVKKAVEPNGKSILVVEDEKPLSHALEMKLKAQGFATKVVTNGQEALNELRNKTYDMVLLDLIMPILDGFGVLEEMKNKKLTVPVIVLSNLGQDEDRAKTKALGAVDYFVKSNTPIADILARVKAAI